MNKYLNDKVDKLLQLLSRDQLLKMKIQLDSELASADIQRGDNLLYKINNLKNNIDDNIEISKINQVIEPPKPSKSQYLNDKAIKKLNDIDTKVKETIVKKNPYKNYLGNNIDLKV